MEDEDAICATISPWSSYKAKQFDISIMIWKVVNTNMV